ncbi:hypothetical protein HPT27_10220 [Permianibacter sp. IMCC34836]|uniref:hypothetical protein n=1 Tax=Permianibacter fluminis TaxID=2738515 RepID=UPI001556ADE7|nr:hypothetical protein [Permianibacter fluminis]NQD37405.1 hypothetical protein [Permianibacter fluminis]
MSTKKNVALVGAGQIGRRHLQSLFNLESEISIDVIDPASHSLEMAKVDFDSLSSERMVRFFQSIQEIDEQYDFAIFATGAAVRLATFRDFSERSLAKAILFEKVLFQSVAQINIANELLLKVSGRAWVNCPRRMYEVYRMLKQRIGHSDVIDMVVDGVGWGLACNSIHFIDLWSYLIGSTEYSLDVSDLIPKVFESKRPGYKEIFGVMQARSGSHSLKLSCSDAEHQPFALIRISTDALDIKISERDGVMAIMDKNGRELEKISFRTPYQSELTARFIEGVRHDGVSDLTRFEDSALLHKVFLEALLTHFQRYGDVSRDNDICPIT